MKSDYLIIFSNQSNIRKVNLVEIRVLKKRAYTIIIFINFSCFELYQSKACIILHLCKDPKTIWSHCNVYPITNWKHFPCLDFIINMPIGSHPYNFLKCSGVGLNWSYTKSMEDECADVNCSILGCCDVGLLEECDKIKISTFISVLSWPICIPCASKALHQSPFSYHLLIQCLHSSVWFPAKPICSPFLN